MRRINKIFIVLLKYAHIFGHKIYRTTAWRRTGYNVRLFNILYLYNIFTGNNHFAINPPASYAGVGQQYNVWNNVHWIIWFYCAWSMIASQYAVFMSLMKIMATFETFHLIKQCPLLLPNWCLTIVIHFAYKYFAFPSISWGMNNGKERNR